MRHTLTTIAAFLIATSCMAWGQKGHDTTCAVYDDTPEGTKISYDYVAKWAPVVEQQFLRGGLRLAHLLNHIFE